MDVEELVHVHGGEAGLRRERRGDRFAYRDAEGERVTDPETLARIAALKIPPAWTDVWIGGIRWKGLAYVSRRSDAERRR